VATIAKQANAPFFSALEHTFFLIAGGFNRSLIPIGRLHPLGPISDHIRWLTPPQLAA
jgi:hypothetical protein